MFAQAVFDLVAVNEAQSSKILMAVRVASTQLARPLCLCCGPRDASQLVGKVVPPGKLGTLVSWLAGWQAGWLQASSADWLRSWLAGLQAGWLAGWFLYSPSRGC